MSGLLRNAANRYLLAVRSFNKNAIRFEKSPTPAEQTQSNPGVLSTKTHRVNNLEKRFLVWTGKFKTIEEIPTYLSPETVEKARNRIRIRLANIMMLLTAVGCIIMIISGKRAAARGESVQKANMEWHRRINEEAKKTRESN